MLAAAAATLVALALGRPAASALDARLESAALDPGRSESLRALSDQLGLEADGVRLAAIARLPRVAPLVGGPLATPPAR